ncbi:MAG: NAD(P)H-dependent oxidoreductase [Phycisphaerae bacterium]|jgi:NAD(P)H-dependent FMN reductase
MPAVPRILAFAGSLRADSYNKKLVQLAAAGARAAGAEVTCIDLRDYPLPIFDEDLERAEGLPANGRKLKDLFLAHDGLLISAPEYNSSISAVLKNTIDWVSRPAPGEEPLGCFAGKVAGLMAASPGALGGLRGLVSVRMILGNIKVIVLPEQLAVARAHEAFNPDGSLKDPAQQQAIQRIAADVTATIRKLRA